MQYELCLRRELDRIRLEELERLYKGTTTKEQCERRIKAAERVVAFLLPRKEKL